MSRHHHRPTPTGPVAGDDTPVRWVDDDAAFAEVVAQMADADQIALDTEFHRERTYFPQLALLQMAWDPDQLVLVDPLAVDLHPLAEVFESDVTIVLHAASQDLEVLRLATGTVPRHVFDTQVAAGFVGFSTPALSALHERLLGVKLPKADRLTDWLVRPLGDRVLEYAAGDVRYLLRIRDLLVADLTERGRLTWSVEECEEQRLRSLSVRDPDQAWLRCKEARSLTGRAATVARAVAAWRERRAAELDIPVRYVLGDLALVSISQRPPESLAALRKVRGIDGRGLNDAATRQPARGRRRRARLGGAGRAHPARGVGGPRAPPGGVVAVELDLPVLLGARDRRVAARHSPRHRVDGVRSDGRPPRHGLAP